MKKTSLRSALAVLAASALLAACGGGGGGLECCIAPPGNGGTGNGSDLPSSALQSVEGLVAYVKDLIANGTNSTGEPVALGNVVLPTSETSEPIP
ncbi:hypothetical protein LZ009_17685 [Ramlibacter sp. XY19]|uniref:hypothetical protein n=1 Tax=Ramlibacter paludis TaxID=2908000 RepID=UPI0023DC77E0|nr:hypothetical protein [Ramlibacter paludis]MCG2594613.1 hypothetical protein [Ramlibacter paludis]